MSGIHEQNLQQQHYIQQQQQHKQQQQVLQRGQSAQGEVINSLTINSENEMRVYFIDLRKSLTDRYFVRFTQGRGFKSDKQNLSFDQTDFPTFLQALDEFNNKLQENIAEKTQSAEGETELAKNVEKLALRQESTTTASPTETPTEKSPKTTRGITRKPHVVSGPAQPITYQTNTGTRVTIIDSFSLISSNLRRKWFVDHKNTDSRGDFVTIKQKTEQGNQTVFLDIADMNVVLNALKQLGSELDNALRLRQNVQEQETPHEQQLQQQQQQETPQASQQPEEQKVKAGKTPQASPKPKEHLKQAQVEAAQHAPPKPVDQTEAQEQTQAQSQIETQGQPQKHTQKYKKEGSKDVAEIKEQDQTGQKARPVFKVNANRAGH